MSDEKKILELKNSLLKNKAIRDVSVIVDSLAVNTAEIIPLPELHKKFLEKKKIIVKLGADPTAPHIHLGHAVVLDKLRDFQQCGCDIVFLIGDFTAQIGDPTGKSKTRPRLTPDQIQLNVKTYVEQIGKIIDIEQTKIVYNNSWFEKFSSEQWMHLLSKATLAQIIERDDFANRLENNIPIGMHELVYPLLQGFDSVVLEADIEIGGTDQKFNMLMGRKLQEAYGREPQVIITMPILPGTDGVQKMSKSLGNDIPLSDSPENAFIKLMSIPDSLVYQYFQYLLRQDIHYVNDLISKHSDIEVKKILAKQVVAKYWSPQGSEDGYNYFTNVIQQKNYSVGEVPVFLLLSHPYDIIDCIKNIDSTLSGSAIRRLIDAGAVSINKEKIVNYKYIYYPKQGDIIKIGKQIVFSIDIVHEKN